MKRSATVAIAVAGLAVALTACDGSGRDKPVVASGIVSSTTAAPTTTTTAPKIAASYDDLSRAIITAVPASYVVQPNDVGDTGPSDLAKAARDDGSADARAVLTQDHFVRGYQRLWAKPDSEQVVAFLYQFTDHAGAVDYGARSLADAAKSDPSLTMTPFDVPGIDGATGVTVHAATFTSSSVMFAKGPYLVQMLVNGPTATGQSDMVRTLAADQFARL